MRSVTHRELRNQSGELLRAVEAGESVVVTNRGKPVAVVAPYVADPDPIEQLRVQGKTRPAQGPVAALRDIRRISLNVGSDELLRDSRGIW